MQHLRCVGLALLAFAASGAAVFAQGAAKVALPDTVECPPAVASIATCYSARHESGAYLLAAMPKDWNGHLIVFAHGGPYVVPPTATSPQADLVRQSVQVKRG